MEQLRAPPGSPPVVLAPAGFDEDGPARLPAALAALARCGGRTGSLLARGRIGQPRDHVGRHIAFADGTHASIYRETTMRGRVAAEPTFLAVTFRLRWVRGAGHRLFRLESELNTPLFVGFPGFVSKLWLAHDQRGAYRGLYEWDGVEPARAYVRALWWPLALVSETSSIRYAVVPGLRRDAALADPTTIPPPIPGSPPAWWRPVAAGAT